MKFPRSQFLYASSFLLPLLLSIYLPLFHYGNNLSILLLRSLMKMLATGWVVALIAYFVFLLFVKDPTRSANASFVFLVFFYTYGIFYNYFLEKDLFRVEHYTLLPFFVLLAVYASWFISKLSIQSSGRLWSNLTLIVGALVVYNIVKIFPAELEKSMRAKGADMPAIVAVDPTLPAQDYPDIYFIILDEFVGFEPIREYWKYEEVDEFVEYLQANDFFIAEQSHGSSHYTLHQLSERLNYEEYPCCGPEYHETHYQAISDNKVMRYLKSKGYSTVVFDETVWKFPAKTPVIADLSFQYDQITSSDSGLFLDEFGIMVADNTMMRAWSRLYAGEDSSKLQHKNMIYFTMNKVADINEVASPKFVYIHLMLPHTPFMFDKNGNLIDAAHDADWNYYLGNYQFAIEVTKTLINNILADADPENPPVIILQSDHGARNQDSPRHISLQNYPEEYKTWILYTLLLPGYDVTSLPQDINPINTFPIIFNYLFDDNIPLK